MNQRWIEYRRCGPDVGAISSNQKTRAWGGYSLQARRAPRACQGDLDWQLGPCVSRVAWPCRPRRDQRSRMGSSLPGESGEYILESRTTIIRVVADLRHAGDIESHLASVCSSQVVRDKVVRQCTAVDNGMRWCAHLSLGLEAMVVMKSCIGGGIVIGGRKQPLHRIRRVKGRALYPSFRRQGVRPSRHDHNRRQHHS